MTLPYELQAESLSIEKLFEKIVCYYESYHKSDNIVFGIKKIFYTRYYLGEDPRVVTNCQAKAMRYAGLLNIREFFVHILKQRGANYLRSQTVVAPINATIYGNVINGTIVAIHSTYVDKFYFKETSIYAHLYSNLKDVLGYKYWRIDDCIVIRMPLYPQTHANLLDVKHLHAAHNFMVLFRKKMNDTNLDISYLTPEFRLKRLFSLRLRENDFFHIYLEVFKRKIADSQQKFICHGDLTSANALIDTDGNLILIDFDKMLVSSEIYDYIHVYISHKIFNARKEISELIKDLDNLIIDIHKFLKIHCARFIPFDEDLIRNECTKILFFKLVERDCNTETLGASIALIESLR